MNGMMIFRNVEFGAIRTMSSPQGEPMFCAKDVAEALGYKNTRDSLKRHVDDDDVVKHDTIDRLGRTQQAIFVNESGLYALILSSKLDSATHGERHGELHPDGAPSYRTRWQREYDATFARDELRTMGIARPCDDHDGMWHALQGGGRGSYP